LETPKYVLLRVIILEIYTAVSLALFADCCFSLTITQFRDKNIYIVRVGHVAREFLLLIFLKSSTFQKEEPRDVNYT